MPLVDVLIPTYCRKTGLAMLLTSLLGQTFTDFGVVIADQTPDEEVYLDSIEVATAVKALEWRGHPVRLVRNLPRLGMAQQRQFLLEQSTAPYVHFLDDDLLLEPQVLERMTGVMLDEGIGFVGCPAAGLGFLDDVRPHEQDIELWEGPVRPEVFEPANLPIGRHRVNNAANPLHLESRLVQTGRPLRYKVAWVGANVLYDREKLLELGGFSWWTRLPPEHAGEEVLAQLLLLRFYGGCGILPSGTYHLGLPTTIDDRRVNALSLYGEVLAEAERKRASRDNPWPVRTAEVW